MMEQKNYFWHTKTVEDVFDIVHSREHGLTKEEVIDRQQLFGQNKLPEGKSDSLWIIFFRQFQSSLIFVLLIAAVIVFLMHEIENAIIIFCVLFFNAIIGTVQEGRAQNALSALKKMTETSATVVRDGREMIVLDTEIVPGDVLVLHEGEKVPSDARIISSNTLQIDEASLTGESGPVTKIHSILEQQTLPITDQKNMIFKGTHVLSGNGLAVAVATGSLTEIGKIARKIAVIDTEIPLKKNIRYLSQLVMIVVAFMIVCIVILGIFVGKSFGEMFSVAVALAVSIIPEGLPIVMTLVLATGVRRMAKHHVLVKRLQAVEALGQTKVIAVDKTGTLTKNEMIVERIYVDEHLFEITGNGYERKGEVMIANQIIDPTKYPELLLSGRIAACCSHAKISFVEEIGAWKVSGDPTEAALMVLSEKFGIRQDILEQTSPKIFDLPFDFQRKYHLTIHQVDQKNFLSAIGAPERILDLCKFIWHKNAQEVLTEEKKKDLENVFIQLAQNGFRVIAFAMQVNSGSEVDPNNVSPLTFVGFFGLRDALRLEVKDSVKKVRDAGMRVIMITGDHKITAQAIAKEADIWRVGDLVMTGEEMDALTDIELAETLSSITVFARVTPDHKLRIIQAYRKRGEIVAMTGDGVNDAPSLVAADLGVAMGKIGTEVAKEASDIILLDDNFASIVSAAEEGRGIYQTIKKVILYLFSTNLGEAFVIAGALLLGFPLPILVSQIIWLNVITDSFQALALSMEPKEPGLMLGKFERPKKWIVDVLMAKRMFFMVIPMVIGTLVLFQNYFETDLVKAWSISLTTLAVFQWFNAWNCRSDRLSIFQMNPFSNLYLVGATVIVFLLQYAALSTTFLQKILHTTPLSFSEWSLTILTASSIIFVEEIRKFFYRKTLSIT